jgi:hypothetical protein
MIARYCSGMLSVAVLVLLLAAPSAAADLTFYIGGINPGDFKVDDANLPLDGSPVFGFRFGSNFVPFFGMEHTIAYSPDFLFPGNTVGISDSRGLIYNSNLVFSLPARTIEPYLTAGVGLIHQWGDPALPVGTKPAFNYGGGIKIPNIKGPIGIRLDIRGYRAGFVTDTVNLLEMSGGVMISIGR